MSPTTECGCRVEPFSRLNSPVHIVDWTIVYCPLHAAAGEMLAALKRYAEYGEQGSYEVAKALIELAEGKASDSKSTERSEDTREK